MRIKNIASLLLLLGLLLLPQSCPAWEDFPRDDQRNYLDYSSDADKEEDYYPGITDDNPYYEDSTSVESGEDSLGLPSDAGSVETPPLPARPAPLPPGPAIDLKTKSIRFGRIPYVSLRELMTKAVPLLSFLKKETGAQEVRLVSNRKDYASVLDALARGNIDFAWVGPTAYLARRDKDKLMPVAKAKFGTRTEYRGVFIALANGKVQGLEDIKGVTVGFVDPESASGYLYPLYLLFRLKINPYKDSRVAFLHNHDNVVRAVLAGKVDVGACLEATLTSLAPELQKKLIVLAKTNDIPSDVIVCRQDCPLNLRESFLKALLKVDAKAMPAGSPSFLAAVDEDFTAVEELMRYIDSLKTRK
ncbi:MAG TPA: phosphate/phosphite/phosphonate ABC transporter substrate-binding protein [Candidatus Rifleibacterium sp.]|nr:phosphate/phosphite/phosphonate ABC transporter substrate-binding protein [Candidatus Rifleibacterium sp.]